MVRQMPICTKNIVIFPRIIKKPKQISKQIKTPNHNAKHAVL